MKVFSKKTTLRLILIIFIIYSISIYLILFKIDSSYTLTAVQAEVTVPSSLISSPVKGIVKNLYVKNGDIVNKGDTLVVIDSIDLTELLSKLKDNQNLLELSSIYQLTQNTELAIRAPASGTVSNLLFVEGTNVEESSYLFSILFFDKYFVSSSFKVNSKQYFSLPSYDNVQIALFDKTVAGKIDYISDQIDPRTSQVNVKIILAEELGRKPIHSENVIVTITKKASFSEKIQDTLNNLFESIKNAFKSY